MKGTTTQVRWIDGSYLMIYAYKTQDIASCKTLCGMCDQQRLRSACRYTQSYQSLCWSLKYSMSVKLLTEHHLRFLNLMRLHRLVWVYTCQNATLLEITCISTKRHLFDPLLVFPGNIAQIFTIDDVSMICLMWERQCSLLGPKKFYRRGQLSHVVPCPQILCDSAVNSRDKLCKHWLSNTNFMGQCPTECKLSGTFGNFMC